MYLYIYVHMYELYKTSRPSLHDRVKFPTIKFSRPSLPKTGFADVIVTYICV